ncbi:MAG: hypothetical protein FWG89_09600 [Treponema sp.]|nr:hypothetical protein [Treponema sp.]
MKYFFFIAGLLMPFVPVSAQEKPEKEPDFSWNMLWSGSWEESRTLHNRADFRLGLLQPGLFMRGQTLDRRTLNFELESPWGDPSRAINDISFGLYHRATGSRLLYGTLDEWGLPARIRSPWIRSAPYADNHKPIMADLKTAASSTKEPEAYMYLSSPRLELFQNSNVPIQSIRGFASMQFGADEQFEPAFSGGLDIFMSKNTELRLEGFYTSRELPAKQSSAWFSDPPPLPDRDFRIGAAAMMLNIPYFSLSSDWAWSQTFAYGSGVYGNVGIRLNPPLSRDTAGKPRHIRAASPWILSLAADGMSSRYTGRDGTTPGGGFRTAGKLEWKGPRSSLFRASTSLRSPDMDDSFNRSSAGLYYRFPALTNRTGSDQFPLRIRRISINADRNASDLKKINDSFDGTLGLSLVLPPMNLPSAFLTASARKVKNPRPGSYPLNITITSNIKMLGSAAEVPSPYPFTPVNQVFDSSKSSCELLWSPGIFQLRTRWAYTAFANKDDLWETSMSAAVRIPLGRFSVRLASPAFPEKWNWTLSWRLEPRIP